MNQQKKPLMLFSEDFVAQINCKIFPKNSHSTDIEVIEGRNFTIKK